MKKLILVFVVSLFVMTSSCKKENENSINVPSETQVEPTQTTETLLTAPTDGKYPEITFEKPEHDFGTIKQGDKVSYEFKFKNTGEGDLIITDAKGSCGCTVPEYPKTPIKPGENGMIKVSFDSTGKSGLNSKSVTLTCNSKEGKKIINIKANIEASLATK